MSMTLARLSKRPSVDDNSTKGGRCGTCHPVDSRGPRLQKLAPDLKGICNACGFLGNRVCRRLSIYDARHLGPKPRGGGLSGAFGGGGGSDPSVFGAKTGAFLTWFTVAMFVCFILLAMAMQWAIVPANQATPPDGLQTENVEPNSTQPDVPSALEISTDVSTGVAGTGNDSPITPDSD